MSGLQYTNPYNPIFQDRQYGVNMPMGIGSGDGSGLQALSGLANLVPFIGPLLGAGMNMISQSMQNSKQEEFYNQYESPQARMAQMKAAGINPNAAAQGISGSAAPQMTAASPTNAYSSIGESLGQSVNSMLSAEQIKANIGKTEAETKFIDSQNVGQNIENEVNRETAIDRIKKAKSDRKISESEAEIYEADATFAQANAAQVFQQNCIRTQQMSAELQNLGAEFIKKCAEIQLTSMQSQLTDAQIHETWSRIGLNNKMIEEIQSHIGEMDAHAELMRAEAKTERAETKIAQVKAWFEKQRYQIYNAYGYDNQGSVMYNFMNLAASGRKDKATEFMNNAVDFASGQYGAKGSQARSWIGTAVSSLAAVGGVVSLFVPGMQGVGSGLLVGGAAGLGATNKARPTLDNSDMYDFSHLGN